MTYRQWLKRVKQSREAAVPDIRERLPVTAIEPNAAMIKRGVVRRAVASAAAAAVLLGALGGTWFWYKGSLPVSLNDSPAGTSSVPVHTTVNVVTMLHSSTPTAVIDNMSLYVGARLMYVSYNMPAEHSECQGVFYDMEQECYICADHIMKSSLEREGIPTKGLFMHYYHPLYGKIVFTCKDSTRSSYVYDVENDTFHRLPISLQYCPGMNGFLQTAHPYVFLHQMGGLRDDLYLIDLRTAELSYILKDSEGNYLYTAMDDGKITEDGKYVHYTLAEGGGEVVNSPARTTVLYEIATGKSRTFIGEIIEYLADSQRFFLHTPDGYMVYNIADAEMIPYAKSDLPAYFAYYETHTDIYTEYDYRLMLGNRITGEETLVTEEYVVASLMKEQYLYYYIRGEEHLRVRDVIGGVEETLPLDKNLLQETESEDNKERALRFGLQIDEESDTIWLYYSVTDAPRESAEKIRQERERWPSAHLERLKETGAFTSIMSLESVLRQFPDFTVTAYEGDGFLYLDYSMLTVNGEMEDGFTVSHINVAFEDYENGAFYTVYHQGDSLLSRFSHDFVGALGVDAQQKTRAMIEELNIPILSAPRDHRDYFSSDPDVLMQAKLNELNGDRVRSYSFCYFIHERNGYTGAKIGLESEEDLQELYAFVDFTDTLTYTQVLDYYSEITVQYYAHHTYIVECLSWQVDSYEIYIGRMDGTPFLVKNDCLAPLTEEQYAQWSSWMDKQEPKCHSE